MTVFDNFVIPKSGKISHYVVVYEKRERYQDLIKSVSKILSSFPQVIAVALRATLFF